MTELAQDFMANLTKLYAEKGFPPHQAWGFTLSAEQKAAFGNELRAHGYLEPMAMGSNASWRLTDQGLDVVLRAIPLSQEAEWTLAFLKQKYQEAGFPNHHAWSFTPAPEAKPINAELRARGYIEPMGMGPKAPMRLTDWGVSELLHQEFTPAPSDAT